MKKVLAVQRQEDWEWFKGLSGRQAEVAAAQYRQLKRMNVHFAVALGAVRARLERRFVIEGLARELGPALMGMGEEL